MSTLDEITKEKQRISEALARVDMQRDKLASQLGELEATERVLARYSKGTEIKKTTSARTPTTAKKAAAPARRHEPTTTAKAAGRKRSSSNLGDQILALATGKTQQEIAAACKGARPNHRRRPFPPQAGGPHRRARWETLRHTVNQDGPTGRALTTGGSRTP